MTAPTAVDWGARAVAWFAVSVWAHERQHPLRWIAYVFCVGTLLFDVVPFITRTAQRVWFWFLNGGE